MAAPVLFTMVQKPPAGPPEYQQAYIDGCRTAQNESRENLFSASRREGLVKNVEMNKLPVYRSMWRSAYIFCGLFVPYSWRNKNYFFKSSFGLQSKYLVGSAKDELLNEAPPGPPNFQYGWRQGCTTGKAATGRNHHKFYYKFEKDYKFVGNKEFDKGWETAFWWCQRHYDVYTARRKHIL